MTSRKASRRGSRKVSRKVSRKQASRKTSRGGKIRMVKLTKSPIKGKKYTAYFSDGTRTHFGAAGMSDYTKHKDDARKGRYMSRHKARENWRNPKSAGALSRWILWNKKSLSGSVADYKRRFRM